ncbi:single-stranded DNA-binding protein [Klebsiella phage KMI8]|nr:single-stranded DNA-binding protein [Klebsiella phage KMI8]
MAINNITVSGNAGKDFEIRTTGNGKQIGSFSIAAVQGYGDYKKTSWLTVKVLSEGFCKVLEQTVKKGSQVVVSGEFVLETWDKDGVQKSMPVIIAREVVSMSQGGGQSQQGGGWGQPQQPQGNQQPRQNSKPQGNQSMDFDDDIPF